VLVIISISISVKIWYTFICSNSLIVI
jgi:hypothetical protein